MKGVIQICFVLFIALTFYYAGQADRMEIEAIELKEELKEVDGAMSRKIHHFDWKQNKPIYTDEVEPDPVHPPSNKPLEYIPDHAVYIEGGTRYESIPPPSYVIIDGKRYRMIQKPDGSIQLKLWR